MRTEGRADRHDVASSPFSQFFERACINTLCVEGEIFNVKPGGIHSDHWALEG